MLFQYYALLNRGLTAQEVEYLYFVDKSIVERVTEIFDFSESYPTAIIVPTIHEKIKYSERLSPSLQHSAQITDVFKLVEWVFELKHENIEESVKYTESLTGIIERLEYILENIKYLESQTTHLTGYNLIVATLALQEVIEGATYLNLEEVILYSEEVNNKAAQFMKLLESLIFSEAAGNTGTSITLFLNESLKYSDTASQTAVLINTIREGISFFGGFQLGDGGDYIAYAVNTQSSGISQYSNFNFNSFSYPYAATSTGIYELTGDTDDGEQIEASFKTGIYDFGSSLKKQVPYAYLGITYDNRVLLKTIVSDRGIKKERWYEVKAYNEAIDTTRVQMGKGVKGRYWQFEVSNIEGEDFSLESMEVLPLILKRRKQ